MTPLSEFDVAVIVAGLFVILACLITFNSIRLHIKNSRQPQIRNFTIRILLMIPVYGIEAWLAIYFSSHAVVFKVLREGYEAFVILSFMQLMLTYLGGPVALARDLSSKGKLTKHLPPLCCVRPWVGARFIRLTLIGTLQYVPASLLVMTVSLITWFTGQYKEGEVSYDTSWVYCAVITNCSQMWALYCLVLFYQGTKEDLRPINPLPKFLCVKLIIFFTWWQGIVITTATHYKWVKLSSDPGVEERAESQLQNFIICIEMLFLAVCHSYAFPSEEFSLSHNPRSRHAALADDWDTKARDAFGPDNSEYKRWNNGRGMGDYKKSPRSMPIRIVKSVGKSINRRVERLQRAASGALATTGDVMSGVNVLDIWKVLRQTQELDAMAQQMTQNTAAADTHTVDFDAADVDLEAADVGAHNGGLGSPKDVVGCKADGQGGSVLTVAATQAGIVVMEESPLHEVLIKAADRGRCSGSSDGGDRERTSSDRLIRSPQPPERERRPSATAAAQRPSTKRELAAAWDVV
jgi:hypothetical protein